MSHSFDFQEWDITVLANSDFSGEATVFIPVDKVEMSLHHGDEPSYEIKLPAGFLKAVSRAALVREMISVLETEFG